MDLTAKLKHLEKKQRAEELLCSTFLGNAKTFFQLAREHEGKIRSGWYFHRGLAYQR